MAVYVPAAKIAVEIADDPTSLPADLDAFPGFTVVPITTADLRNPIALNRTVKRIARAAQPSRHATGGTAGAAAPSKQERKRLQRLISRGLELSCGTASAGTRA